jgi:hypothetical protein
MKLKILSLSSLIVLFSLSLTAQNVGINPTGVAPDASAMLDVSSTNKGVLIPRVALTLSTSSAPITAPATSLLVYNTATINDVSPGYYYWNGSSWMRFFTGNQSDDWALTGNAGTNPSSNFLGTTDAQNLIFRTSNTEKMRIESGGDVGIGTTTPDAKFHSHQSGTASGDIAIMATQNINLTTGITAALFVAGGTDYDIYQYSSGRNALWANTAIGHNNPTQALDVDGNIRLREHLYDATNSPGNDGDILSRDASGVLWINTKNCTDYINGFEGSMGYWRNVTNDNRDWEINSGSTSSSSTGPTSANEGANYIYCETSGSLSGDVFNLEASVTTCDNPSMSFDYHMYFNTYTDGTLNLQVSTNGGTTWTTLWTRTGNQGNLWYNDQSISLAPYSNSTIMLRFSFTVGSLGSSFYYDCSLDDIRFYDIDHDPDMGNEAWVVSGNAGTLPDVNFVGTTDNSALSFRTNDTEHMRIQDDGTVSIGSTNDYPSNIYNRVENTNSTNYTALYNYHYGSYTGTTYALYNYNSSTTNSTKYGIRNYVSSTGTGGRYGIYNYTYQNSASTSTAYGLYNYTRSYGSSGYGINNYSWSYGDGSFYGERNYIGGSGNAVQYGEYISINNTGTGAKYGSYYNMTTATSGTKYGIYMDLTTSGSTTDYAMWTTGGNVHLNSSSGNYDFQVRTQARTHALFVDADNDVVRCGLVSGSLTGNGTTPTGTSGVIDYVADFDKGGSYGTTIGVGSVEYLFDQSSETMISNRFSPTRDGSYTLGKSTHRWNALYATNGTIQTSDEKQKKNITTLNYGLSEILKISPISFEWREEKQENVIGDVHLGFSAQDLLQIVPDVVQTHEMICVSEEPLIYEKREVANLGVYYAEIIPVLVRALQEEDAKVEELQAKVSEQDETIEDLQSKYEALLKRIEELEKN